MRTERPSSRTAAPKPWLQHLRGRRDDLHEPLLPQLPADRAEDAGAAGVATVPDQDSGVLVEADVGTIGAPALLRRTDHDRLDDVALLHTRTRQGVLDGADDDVADRRVAPTRAAQHADAEQLLGAGVVGDPKA